MKTSLLTALSLTLAASAHAQFTESFTYENGPLIDVSGGAWVTTSGVTPGQQNVVSGQLFLDDNETEDTARAIGTNYVSGTITGSFDFRADSNDIPSSLAASALYFAHFLTQVVGTTSTNVARVTMIDGGGGTFPTDTTFTLGISTNTDAVSTSFADAPFSVDTTYRLTLSYDFATSLASLTVDGFGTIVATDIFAATAGLDRFGFRQSSGAAGDAFIDNLVVIPEPTTAISLLSGLALLGLIRRRRA